ncbi:hypothetical protein [Actinomadura sp. WMMB 499]|uniref:hypothetical protein n=1 Tax=Actinomadura sp. WMMB 499 TaxID=1219491 RepID=UPI001248B2B4|nr:hypothetical protein [Actinomadura sp. WMMB 499]QFG25704.1 hypothetical protein F7P10_35725 [Actinomadura sp. WMMB 499]
MAVRTGWRAGPASAAGPVLVSVTDFTAASALDLPGVFRAGMALRRSWPDLPGAVGLWLWAIPAERRCGSVSVWTDAAALRGFVALPEHVAIMRRYRGRGGLRSVTWEADAFDARAAWARAARVLAGEDAPGAAAPRQR